MKKVLSLFLTLALLCALLPAARAAGTAWDGSVDISWYDPDASEYYLSTPAQLAGLVAAALAIVVSAIRRRWYREYGSVLEALCTEVLELTKKGEAR